MLLSIFFSALMVSMVVSVIVIRTQHLHGRLSFDSPNGVQKFHASPTPRIGGVPVVLGLVAAFLTAKFSQDDVGRLSGLLLLTALPVFLAGLVEDISKRVSPRTRLLAAFCSAGLAAAFTEAILPTLGIPGIDNLIGAWPFVGFVVTVFAVGGVCHAINIIDGYNGLMGGVALLVTAALAYVALAVGDLPILVVCLALAASIAGFLIWNFPRGLIFAGDAGAYLIGFLLAEISVLLVARHPGVVSPWFPLLLLIYPVFETLFSIWRRSKCKMEAVLPDSMHLHQMIYKKLVRWMVGSREAKHLTRRNSMTAPYLWGVTMCSVMPALLFWKAQWALQVCAVLFATCYVWAYHRLVTFRSPRSLVLRKSLGRKSSLR